jgi:putative ATP-dependent endonuclease of OLD family
LKLRRLVIKNFRGIEHLEWSIPSGKKVICLIGAGDVGKTTIVSAISWLLSDRWSLPTSINDFHDESKPIVVEGLLSNLPDSLLAIEKWGSSLCSVTTGGDLAEPSDLEEVLACLRLTIDCDTLEPRWELIAPGSDPVTARSADRRRLGAAMLDDRVDSHFRWTSTSALGKMTSDAGGAKTALREATLAARNSFQSANISAELQKSLDKVSAGAAAIGAGNFCDLQPGIDLTGGQYGGVCLYEGTTPLSAFGLGSRRLAALSIQKASFSGKSTYLIDEIESGLEPHRVVGLIEAFRRDDSVQQVFMTTHSPSAVESCDASELAVVSREGGEARVSFLPTELQALHRSNPSSFLAKRILICEGATEEGLLRSFIRLHDKDRQCLRQPTSVSYGVTVCNGGGGSSSCKKARQFADLGYKVFLLLDSDDRTIEEQVGELGLKDELLHRWNNGQCVESAIFHVLARKDILALISATIEYDIASKDKIAKSFDAIGRSLKGEDPSAAETWTELSDEGLRDVASKASVAKKKDKNSLAWYKNVRGGIFLGDWLGGQLGYWPEPDVPIDSLFEKELKFIYPSE